MRLLLAALLVVVPLVGQSVAKTKPPAAAAKQDTPRFEIINEWIRQLGAFHDNDLKVRAEAAADDKSGSDHFARMIRNSTRNLIELNRSIRTFKKMRVSGEKLDWILPAYVTLLQDRVGIYEEYKKIGAAGISGSPQPGVDYAKLAARAPELEVLLEKSNSAFLQLMPVFTHMLIDRKVSADGHLDHLQITRRERDQLIRQIEAEFGKDLGNLNNTFLVASAKAMLAFLKGEHKSADDPWT